VRVTNEPAQALYRKYGFTVHGVRKRYYSDNNEDALIMTTESFGDPVLDARIEELRAALDASPAPEGPFEADPDPTHDEPPAEAGG
jgi:ribosomal-protein-alanine N-acetyltransferase